MEKPNDVKIINISTVKERNEVIGIFGLGDDKVYRWNTVDHIWELYK